MLMGAHNFIDRTGGAFGILTAVEPTVRVLSSGRRMPAWRLRCACGNEVVAMTVNLTKGKHTSCGCTKKAKAADTRELKVAKRQQRPFVPAKVRGPSVSKMPEYRVYRQMRDRCYLPTAPNYRWYGAKGVTVCDRWLRGTNQFTGFECFIADMGPRPKGLTLERDDPRLPYEPGNCRWATWKEQGANHRVHQLPEADRREFYRKRALRGEANARAILTNAKVAQIKRMVLDGARTSHLAARFGVAPQTISSIKANRHWAHIEAAPEQLSLFVGVAQCSR